MRVLGVDEATIRPVRRESSADLGSNLPMGSGRPGWLKTPQSITTPPVRLISVAVMVAAQSEAANSAALATS